MPLRNLFAYDNDSLVVDSSSSAGLVGNGIINNSDTPNGTVFTYTNGIGRTSAINDDGGDPDTFEDDQSATHTVADGRGLVPDGTPVEAESIIQLRALDVNGTPIGPTLNVTVFSQNGQFGNVWGFSADIALVDGVSYQKISGSNIGSSSYTTFVTCFGPGTLIETGAGEVPVSALSCGTPVWTLTAGLQPITWIGRSTVAGTGACAPVTIEAGAIGNARPLIVSQEHRIYFADDTAALLFGTSEVLIAAKHLCGLPGVTITPTPSVTYTHFMFDAHHVVRANGLLAESFFFSETALAGSAQTARTELMSLYPSLDDGVATFGPTAALCLKRHEADLWRTMAAA